MPGRTAASGAAPADVRRQHGTRGLEVPIHALEPRPGRAGVVHSRDAPLVDERQIVSDAREQIIGGHRPAGEKVPRNPVGASLGVEPKGQRPVGEDMHEQAPVGSQPARHPGKQRTMVAHVFEHLDGHDAIERPIRDERVHVGGDHAHVGESARGRRLFDVRPLGRAVRDARHRARGVVLGQPERQRPPAAPQIEHLVAVVQVGALRI